MLYTLPIATKQVAFPREQINNCALMPTSPHSLTRRAARVKAALMLTGFSAVMGQVVLMRELMIVFNGNESSIGILLATWLFWTAVGSFVCGRLALCCDYARRAVALFECLLGFSLPATIFALRASKSVFQSVPGELVGPLPALLASLACLSLFCAVAGALFVAAAQLVGEDPAVGQRKALGAAYLLEAAGSALGGIASLVLLRSLAPFQIAGIVLFLNLSMAAILLSGTSRKLLASAAIVIELFAVVRLAPWLDIQSRARQWCGFHLLASRDSVYGNLTVTETGSIRSLYENGLILASAPDESAAEESVHYALLEHPAPRRVLLIGGGANGSVAQALKHPTIERIDLVELDPTLIVMTHEFLPSEPTALSSDPRVRIHFTDGRAWLASTLESFDVIIVNAPGPQTAQLNRFYTVEFFRSARAHLAPNGLLALQLRSSEEAISPDLAGFLRCINRTLREVFPNVVSIPGDTIHFFGAASAGVLTGDPQTLIARLQQRKLQTRYVSKYFIPFRMMPDRMDEVRERLQPLPATQVNRDFSPIAYYFNAVLWSAQFKPDYASWLRTAGSLNFKSVLGTVLLALSLMAAMLAFLPAREQRSRSAAALSIGAAGFTMMALQIFLLLAFQSIYGFVYSQLAILIALFMAGIALGGWLGLRRIPGDRHSLYRRLASTQLSLAFSAPLLIMLAAQLARLSSTAATWLAAQCIFPALAALCGILGGYQFPMATALAQHNRSGGRNLGMLYSVDLIGGCAGALLLSGYLIPVFGFWGTAWLCVAINLAPTLLTAWLSFRRNDNSHSALHRITLR